MEQRISLITLGVADLDRSRAFYEGLGWRRSVKDAEGVCFFQVGGLVLSLWPRASVAEDANLTDDGGKFAGIALAYNCRSKADVDAVLAEAVAAGARLLKPATDTFWGGYSGHFADPDGYAWEVAWNPGFTLNDDGSITLPD